MARDYAAVPHEYLEEMQRLNDAEFGRLMRALLAYSRTGEPMALSGNERFHIERVMAEEDRHKRSYEETVNARSRAGRASAAARQQRAALLNSDEQNAYSDSESNSEPKTETERKSSFSYEKRTTRGWTAPQYNKDKSWMKDYD